MRRRQPAKVLIISTEGRDPKFLGWERDWYAQGVGSLVNCSRGMAAWVAGMRLEASRPHHEILMGHDEASD